METNRAWMYQRILDDKTINPVYIDGVTEFLDFAFGNPRVISERKGKKCIRCPCASCDNFKFLERDEVSKHLLLKGFRPLYQRWHKHGESYSAGGPSTVTEGDIGENRMESIMDDDRSGHEEPPNAKEKEFYDLLEAANAPLWEIKFNGETKAKCEHTVLSFVTQFLKLKSDFQMSEDCFNDIMSLMKSVLPPGAKLPLDFCQAKKLVQELGMDYGA